MMSFKQQVIEDHINHFSVFDYKERLLSSENRYYMMELTDHITYYFGVSVTYISNKWYIHYYNAIHGDDNNQFTSKWSNKNHHKNNFLLTCKKSEYQNILKELIRFQSQLIADILT